MYSLDLTQQTYILLKNGSASGAMARWRSVFECSVVMLFLLKYPESSEPYIEHAKINEYKYHKSILKLAGEEKFNKFNKDYFNILTQKYKSLIRKYGKTFSKDYGWAEIKLNKFNNLSNLSKEVERYNNYLISKEASMYNHASSFNRVFEKRRKGATLR